MPPFGFSLTIKELKSAELSGDRLANPAQNDFFHLKTTVNALPDNLTASMVEHSRRDFLKFLATLPFANLAEHEQPLAPIIRHGSRSWPAVAITIDDAWQSRWVEQALRVFEEKGVRGTLFPAGVMVSQQAQLWRAAHLFRHEFGNHTFFHHDLTGLANQEILWEIKETQRVLNIAAGHPVPIRFLRPPGMAGFTSPDGDGRIRRLVAQCGLKIALWDVDSNAARYPDRVGPREVFQTVVNSARSGSIILLHFTPADILALPDIIDNLKEKFELVTLSQLLRGPIDQVRDPSLPLFSSRRT